MSMTVSVRIEGKKARATSGQVKHDTREGKQPEYVDQEKTKLNSVLVEPMPENAHQGELRQGQNEKCGVMPRCLKSALSRSAQRLKRPLKS